MPAVEPPSNQELKDLLLRLFSEVEQFKTSMTQTNERIDALEQDIKQEIE